MSDDDLKTYSESDINKVNKDGGCLIVMHSGVYDVKDFLSKHPGGKDVIISTLAKNIDVTKSFELKNHSDKARKMAKELLIGKLKNSKNNVNNILKIENKQKIEEKSQSKFDVKDVNIIGWGDLFSVKIDILDKQHKKLVYLINQLYKNGEFKDFKEFHETWQMHTKTEELLFKEYKFEEDKALAHRKDHERIEKLISETVEKWSKKHKKKEIQLFSKELAKIFKLHAFEYDSLYIDKLNIQDKISTYEFDAVLAPKSKTPDILKYGIPMVAFGLGSLILYKNGAGN